MHDSKSTQHWTLVFWVNFVCRTSRMRELENWRGNVCGNYFTVLALLWTTRKSKERENKSCVDRERHKSRLQLAPLRMEPLISLMTHIFLCSQKDFKFLRLNSFLDGLNSQIKTEMNTDWDEGSVLTDLLLKQRIEKCFYFNLKFNWK